MTNISFHVIIKQKSMRALFVNFYLRKDSVVVMKSKRLVSAILVVAMMISLFAVTAVSSSAATKLKYAPIIEPLTAVDHGINAWFKPVDGVEKYRVYYRWTKDEEHTRYKTITANGSGWQNVYIGVKELSPTADLKAIARKHAVTKNGKLTEDSAKLMDAVINSNGTSIPLYITVRGINNKGTAFTTEFKDVEYVWGLPFSMSLKGRGFYVANNMDAPSRPIPDIDLKSGDLGFSYYPYVEDRPFDRDCGNIVTYARDFKNDKWISLGVASSDTDTGSGRVINMTKLADEHPECIDKNGDVYLTCRKETKDNTYWDCGVKITGAKYAKSKYCKYYNKVITTGKISAQSINLNKSDDINGVIPY